MSELYKIQEHESVDWIVKKVPKNEKKLIGKNVPISVTCFDVNLDLFVLGTSNGYAHIIRRSSNEVDVILIKKNSTINNIKIIFTIDVSIAFGFDCGSIVVIVIPYNVITFSVVISECCLFQVPSEHQASITCLHWSKNAEKLYTGDCNGVIFCTEVNYFDKSVSSYRMCVVNSPIVELCYDYKHLLVSTKSESFIFSTDNVKLKIGQKPRTETGQFGICYILKMCCVKEAELICVRSDSKLFICDLTGSVKRSIIMNAKSIFGPDKFISLLPSYTSQMNNKLIDQIQDNLIKYQLGHALALSEELVLFWSKKGIVLVNILSGAIINSSCNLGRIINVAVVDIFSLFRRQTLDNFVNLSPGSARYRTQQQQQNQNGILGKFNDKHVWEIWILRKPLTDSESSLIRLSMVPLLTNRLIVDPLYFTNSGKVSTVESKISPQPPLKFNPEPSKESFMVNEEFPIASGNKGDIEDSSQEISKVADEPGDQVTISTQQKDSKESLESVDYLAEISNITKKVIREGQTMMKFNTELISAEEGVEQALELTEEGLMIEFNKSINENGDDLTSSLSPPRTANDNYFLQVVKDKFKGLSPDRPHVEVKEISKPVVNTDSIQINNPNEISSRQMHRRNIRQVNIIDLDDSQQVEDSFTNSDSSKCTEDNIVHDIDVDRLSAQSVLAEQTLDDRTNILLSTRMLYNSYQEQEFPNWQVELENSISSSKAVSRDAPDLPFHHEVQSKALEKPLSSNTSSLSSSLNESEGTGDLSTMKLINHNIASVEEQNILQDHPPTIHEKTFGDVHDVTNIEVSQELDPTQSNEVKDAEDSQMKSAEMNSPPINEQKQFHEFDRSVSTNQIEYNPDDDLFTSHSLVMSSVVKDAVIVEKKSDETSVVDKEYQEKATNEDDEQEDVEEHVLTDDVLQWSSHWISYRGPNLVNSGAHKLVSFCVNRRMIWMADNRYNIHVGVLNTGDTGVGTASLEWTMDSGTMPCECLTTSPEGSIIYRMKGGEVFVYTGITRIWSMKVVQEKVLNKSKWEATMHNINHFDVDDSLAVIVTKTGQLKIISDISSRTPYRKSQTALVPGTVVMATCLNNIVWCVTLMDMANTSKTSQHIFASYILDESANESESTGLTKLNLTYWRTVPIPPEIIVDSERSLGNLGGSESIHSIHLGTGNLAWLLTTDARCYFCCNISPDSPNGQGIWYQISLRFLYDLSGTGSVGASDENIVKYGFDKLSVGVERMFGYSELDIRNRRRYGSTTQNPILISTKIPMKHNKGNGLIWIASPDKNAPSMLFESDRGLLGHRWIEMLRRTSGGSGSLIGLPAIPVWLQVAIGCQGAAWWLLHQSGELFCYYDKSKIRSVSIPRSYGRLKSICAYNTAMMLLTTSNNLLVRVGVSYDNPLGNSWNELHLPKLQDNITFFACTDNMVWFIHRDHLVYSKNISRHLLGNQSRLNWELINLKLRDNQKICCLVQSSHIHSDAKLNQLNTVWGLSEPDGQVYMGERSDFDKQFKWNYIPGPKGKSLHIHDSSLWMIEKDYGYTSYAPLTIPSAGSSISVSNISGNGNTNINHSNHGASGGSIFVRTNQHTDDESQISHWTEVPCPHQPIGRLAVANNNRVVIAIDCHGQIQQHDWILIDNNKSARSSGADNQLNSSTSSESTHVANRSKTQRQQDVDWELLY